MTGRLLLTLACVVWCRWLTLAIGAAAYFWVRDLLGVDDTYNWGSFIYVTSGAALFLFIVAVYGWPRKSK